MPQAAPATKILKDDLDLALQDFRDALDVVNRHADRIFIFKVDPIKQTPNVCLGAVEALKKLPNNAKKWVAEKNYEKAIEWLYFSYEFGEGDTSIVGMGTPNIYDWPAYRIVDQGGGFEQVRKRLQAATISDRSLSRKQRSNASPITTRLALIKDVLRLMLSKNLPERMATTSTTATTKAGRTTRVPQQNATIWRTT